MKRRGRTKNEDCIVISLKVEDMFLWISIPYEKLSNRPQILINCFGKAGFTNQMVLEEKI